jgi:nitrite reductase (NADH) large subunit
MRRYVIVGNGVAGVTAARSIVRADPTAEVHIFGAEPYPYYHRPRLWELIAGEVEQDALYFRPPEWYAERGIHVHLGVQVTSLDPSAHCLTLSDGSIAEYDRLLLATGGRPFVPPFEGTGCWPRAAVPLCPPSRELAGRASSPCAHWMMRWR